MTDFKLSYDQLQIISSCLTSNKDDEFVELLDKFLTEKIDDYYFCRREPINTQYLEIGIEQLKRIVAYVDMREYPSLYSLLNSVWQSADVSNQKSVFLYGRKR